MSLREGAYGALRHIGGGGDGDRRGAGALGRGDVVDRGPLQRVVDETEDVGEVRGGTSVHAHDERAPRGAVVLGVRESDETHEAKR